MATKYLDSIGLAYFWGKIKALFAKKVSGATSGNFAALDSNGDLTDSGKKPSDFPKVYTVNDITAIPSNILSSVVLGDIVNDPSMSYTVAHIQSGIILFIHQDKIVLTTHRYDNGTYTSVETHNLSHYATKVNGATNGNFAGLNSSGDLTDSGSKAEDFATAAQGALADSSIQGVSVNGTALTPSSGVVNVSVPTETSDLTNDSGFVDTATDELLYYYKKSQTYSQAEVDALISAVNTFEYVSVNTLPTASSSTMGKVYIYNGHRYITEEDNGSYSWTDLGSYDIDLSEYVTTTTLNTALENRPVFQEVTETQMQNLLDNGTWEQGVLYYTVEQEEE